MAGVRPTARFDKAMRHLGPTQRKRAAKSLAQFVENPRHPSLHFEKLSGSDYCTIRVERNFRIVLKDLGGDLYELLDIGSHDYVYRQYG